MECRNRSFIGPLILIGLGVVLLLANLGKLPWNTWETVLRLWPILLIAIGLEVVLGRGSIWGGVVLALLVLGLAGVLTVIDGGWRYFGRPSAFSTHSTREVLQIPHRGVKRAEIELNGGVGELHITSGAASEYLVEGTILRGSRERIEHDYRVTGETGRFILRSRNEHGYRGSWGSRNWRLEFNQAVPLAFTIRTGVGLADLDLSQLRASAVEVRTGVGRTTMTLPRTGEARVVFHGGVGETSVAIPAGVAVRIRIYRGIGSVEVNGDYNVKDGIYTSPGYSGAKNRVDLEIRGGIGRIMVTREDTGTW